MINKVRQAPSLHLTHTFVERKATNTAAAAQTRSFAERTATYHHIGNTDVTVYIVRNRTSLFEMPTIP